jgi:cytochrome P450
MSALGPTIKFAADLYRQRAKEIYAGYVAGDELALLTLRSGRANPYKFYERMRAHGTLTPTHLGNWATTSYRVCDSVLRDRRFGVGYKADRIPAAPPGVNRSFVLMNPPDHTRLRRLATPAFTLKAVASYQPRIEKLVGELLDEVPRNHEFDLVSAFAAPLPITVITDLLGFPDSDIAALNKYGIIITSGLDGIRSMRHAAQLNAARGALIALFQQLIELRRHEPRDDIISHLIAAEGDQVKPAEMLPLCLTLLVAGFETTTNLIGNGALALLDNPDQWQALRADPEGAAARVVEETLRFKPSIQAVARIATEPLELEGQQVRKDQLVIAMIAAANRDPEVYDRPQAFDIGRENPAPHLAFSGGIHYCLGHYLARLQATIAFRLLAERLPDLRRTGPVTRRDATMMHGPLRLPVSAA